MPRRKPSHPGKLIANAYLKPSGPTGRELAELLRVSASTLSRILDGKSAISPEMAVRLSKVLGRSAESWLVLQNAYDLDEARRRVSLAGIRRLKARGGRSRLEPGRGTKHRSNNHAAVSRSVTMK